MLASMLEKLRSTRPLIHNISNYVTANDCANILLACGASPIMADDPGEAEEITSLCSGLHINIGTLNSRSIPAMFAAGRRANELGHPIVLDPVGAGASALRTDTALKLMHELHPSILRGNISEIRTLACGSGKTQGVDACAADRVTEATLDSALSFAKAFASEAGCILAITGPIDIVTDGTRACCIRSGHPDMGLVTGTGCQLSAMTAAFAAANPGQLLEATVAAVCAMGLAGETAHARLGPLDGNSTYRNYIIDAICRLTPDALGKGANYEMR